MNFQEKLAGVVSRYEEVQSLLASPSIGADELVKLNKEISVLEPVVEAIHNYQKQEKSFKEAGELMQDASMDKEMRELAETEYYELKEKLPELEKKSKFFYCLKKKTMKKCDS